MTLNKILNIWIFQDFEKELVLKNNMNSLIKIENGKYCIYNTSKKEKTSIELEFKIINIEDIIQHTEKILISANKAASFISLENMDNKIDGIVDLVKNILYKFDCIMKQDRLDVFDFFAEILFKIIISHKLLNGNKRMGLLSLIYFMEIFGYYLCWTKNKEKTNIEYSKYYEEFLNKIIIKHHKKQYEKDTDKLILKEIKKVLLKHTVINISNHYKYDK